MIQLIVGKKGSGKTKTLIDMVNQAAQKSEGSVVCIEKGNALTFDISSKVRLVDADEYELAGFDNLFGMLSGLLAGNYDITDIFVDATFKIGGPEKDFDGFGHLIEKLAQLKAAEHICLTFTVSCEESELPDVAKKYIVHSHN